MHTFLLHVALRQQRSLRQQESFVPLPTLQTNQPATRPVAAAVPDLTAALQHAFQAYARQLSTTTSVAQRSVGGGGSCACSLVAARANMEGPVTMQGGTFERLCLDAGLMQPHGEPAVRGAKASLECGARCCQPPRCLPRGHTYARMICMYAACAR